MAPGCANMVRDVCNRTWRTLRAIPDASGVGSGLNVVGRKVGGVSWLMSMLANDIHTAVSWRCAAKQTSSSNGPGGRDITETSDGSAVMALNKSLSACNDSD